MGSRFALSAAIFLLLLHEGHLLCSMTEPCADQLGQGAPFQESEQLSSESSDWSISLNVDITTTKYNWLEIMRRNYNGKIAGPTWNVKQGDTVRVTLKNLLSADGNDLHRPLNRDNYPNSTNLHTHGLHISSVDPQDNVLHHVKPGQTYEYVYQIHAKQPAGTFWYHAHLHGSTKFQVLSGLSGILIVQDNLANMPPELAAASCPDNCNKDIQMLFQPILMLSDFLNLQQNIRDWGGFRNYSYNASGGENMAEWLKQNVNYFTTNGQLQPELDMTTGEMYRFRMVNAGGGSTLELYITDTNNTRTTNCEIREISVDGVYLDAPRKMQDFQTFLSSGSKVDWLVKCNVVGTYKLRSCKNHLNDLSIGSIGRFDGDLVILNVSGTPISPTQKFPTTLPSRPNFLNDLRNIPQSDINGRFVVELDQEINLNRDLWSGGDNYRYKMTVGTIQEWHFLNSGTSRSHPLHIHVNHFQVISYNNYTGAVGGFRREDSKWQLNDINALDTPCRYQRKKLNKTLPFNITKDALKYWGHNTRFSDDNGTLGYSRIGDWRDTLLVPPLANITVRFLAHELVGDVIIHCHILGHEDAGMMMIVKVVPEGANTKANVKSGDAYPGTCRKCDRYPFNNPIPLCGDGSWNYTPAVAGIFAGVFVVLLVIVGFWGRKCWKKKYNNNGNYKGIY